MGRAWRSAVLWRVASIGLFAVIAAWILLSFRDYGISNDEPVQHTYGQLLLAWYASGFTDDRAFHYINLYLYGGLFDLIAAGLQPYVPLPLYEWRHLLSAGFGLVGLIGVWRLGQAARRREGRHPRRAHAGLHRHVWRGDVHSHQGRALCRRHGVEPLFHHRLGGAAAGGAELARRARARRLHRLRPRPARRRRVCGVLPRADHRRRDAGVPRHPPAAAGAAAPRRRRGGLLRHHRARLALVDAAADQPVRGDGGVQQFHLRPQHAVQRQAAADRPGPADLYVGISADQAAGDHAAGPRRGAGDGRHLGGTDRARPSRRAGDAASSAPADRLSAAAAGGVRAHRLHAHRRSAAL